MLAGMRNDNSYAVTCHFATARESVFAWKNWNGWLRASMRVPDDLNFCVNFYFG